MLLAVFSTALAPSPVSAAGATLFLSPASGSYAVNKSFTVKIMVNSGGGVGINASEGSIKFDSSILTVASVSKGGSIFSLWTSNGGEGPGFSNSNGTITYGGGSPTSYKGTAGTIFSVTFTAKKAGTAKVTFTSGVVLAADGMGTNVFSSFGNGTYTITEAAKTEEPKKTEEKKPEINKGILPPLPEIECKSHPNENTWYPNNDPEFSWKLLADLTGVSFKITTDPLSDPGPSTEGILETTKIDNTFDDVQYFHIKFQNRNGWGQIAHKKIMVDATAPEAFGITLDSSNDPTNPVPKLRFRTIDKTSGIDYYTVINGTDSKKVTNDEVKDGYYQTSPLAPGEHNIAIAATDKAGNSASSSITFIVEPLKAPIITSIPKTLSKKDQLIIRGTSFYPQVTVKLYIAKSEKEIMEFSTQTDDQGNWSYFHKGELEKGNYEVWAKIVDNRGAQSLDSSKEIVSVVSPSIICNWGWLILLILIVIIICLLLYILYERTNYLEEKDRIYRETQEVKEKTKKIFYALREETDELMELTDKKPGLSENERRVKEKLQESLDIAEEFINKEIMDVEKEINMKKKDK